MATRFLKSGNPVSLFVIILGAAALRSVALWNVSSLPTNESETYFYSLFFSTAASIPWLSFVLAFILAAFQGFFFNKIVEEQKLIPRVSNLPFAIYLLFSSLIPALVFLSPQLLGLTFAVFAIKKLFSNSKSTFSVRTYFLSGLFLGAGALFEQSMIVFLLFPVINTLYFHVQYVRSILVPLTGFILSIYLAHALASFIGGEFIWPENHLQTGFAVKSKAEHYSLALFATLLLGFGFAAAGKLASETVQVRKMYLLFFWWSVLFVFSAIISSSSLTSSFALSVPAVSAFAGYSIFLSKRIKIANGILYGLLVLTIINQLFM